MRYLGTRVAKVLAPQEAAIGDKIPYAGHLDEVTLKTRNGLLVQTIHLKGFPFETASDEDLNYRKMIRETLLRGAVSSRLAIYHHVVRRQVVPRFEEPPANSFCRQLDEAWRARLARRQLYQNEIFLSLVRRPLQGGAGVIERLLRKPGENAAMLERELRELHATRETFLATLAPYGPRTLSLYRVRGGLYSEPAEFLSLLLGENVRRILAPSGDLGQSLATRRLSFGYDAMEFGQSGAEPSGYGAMIGLKDYPLRSMPGMLDGVLRLPFEMVLTESFAYVEQATALSRMNQALRRLRAADNDAVSLRSELAQAKDDVAAGRSAYGEHHLSILVRAPSLERTDQAVAEVQSALAETGAIAVREDMNLEPSFWAQFPGNFPFIARKSLVSTGNFASLASFHNHPTGQEAGNHWGGPIALLETTAFGPYNFNFHSGDLGNFTVIGPSGSGKTALLAFLLAQAERKTPRIVYFDKDRGAEGFIRAIGGSYDIVSPGVPTGFNPLALPDTGENRAFLSEWLTQLLGSHGAPVTPDDRVMVADAIDANFAQPPAHRRLRYLRELFRGQRRPSAGDLAARLGAWCDGGEHAWLFDNEVASQGGHARVTGFDMTRLLSLPVIRTPAMMYLFHGIEQRLDGSPTIIVVDEGWKALDDEVFVRKIKDWEKTIRKRNGLIGFCTQNADDALESRVGPAIIEQSATQIFFPNSKARASDYVAGFGLSQHEFDLVRSLPDTSHCFLIKQSDHSVVARLDLSGMKAELRVLAGNESSVRQLDSLREKLGDEPEKWLAAFMSGPDRSAA